MLNLAAVLENSARAVPDRTAVVLGVQRLTYAELDAAARRVANLLRSRGIAPGDKVALSCPNVPWFPIVYYGILKAGAVVVPLNVLLKGREVAYHLADSEAKAYFCFEGGAELPLGQEGWAGFGEAPGCEHFFLMPAAPTQDSSITGAETLTAALAGQSADFETVATESGDTAVILYTSGTTGRPKGAELTHSNVMLNVLTCHKLFGEIEHDVHLVTLPLFHSFGQVVQMNAGLASGATLVLLPRFDARSALALMQRHAVTFFAGVPTMYWALLEEEAPDVDLPQIARNLRMAGSGARRSRSRSTAGSPSGSASPFWRGTGSPRPARWPRSPRVARRCGPAPSDVRSGAWRWTWSARTGPPSRVPTPSARSSSADTT